ncbi:MAG TPA: sigma-54 dependent transcriptional regulator [bacterium]|nr:sigma-54 dependent transcriptional regulator [bacterium]HOY43147.1 sigma-54 dependent transcriptional regulator [bacterium]HPG82670.1 sigma-54 dependent transcriptional regulator [bacterium]
MKRIKGRVLIAEDDSAFAAQLASVLEGEDYQVVLARDGNEAVRQIAGGELDIGFIDLAMPGLDGMQVLEKAVGIAPDLPLVVITGHASIDRAIQATRLGAFDFLEKPVNLERVLLTVERALGWRQLEQKNNWMAAEIMNRYRMVGTSPGMQDIYARIDQVAPTESTVLITGETGTGKELVAMAIHLRSHRAAGPFMRVNCAAIPDTLIESELFGHRKGAFTGATENHDGKFMQAAGGSLFLDEIGDLSQPAQAKLLRVLQSREVEAVGAARPQPVDVRIIAATNKNLTECISKGLFREDLYYRVCVIDINLPPLRERKEDIPELSGHFLNYFCGQYNRRLEGFTPAALQTLMNYHWPGNVRQLRSCIERAVILARGESLSEADLRLMMSGKPVSEEAPATLRQARERFEKSYIEQVLKSHDWKMEESAATLGIDRTNLYKKMQKLGIHRE